jgi:hypothetical protein
MGWGQAWFYQDFRTAYAPSAKSMASEARSLETLGFKGFFDGSGEAI